MPLSVHEHARQLRQRLDSGETLLGSFLSLGSPLVAEIVGGAGFDFALIDLEHGAVGEASALAQMQALAATGCAGLVRVESTARQRVHRVLDSGAHGVMFPRIDSPADAAAAVAAMRYPPHGVRGVATVTRASQFGPAFQDYFNNSNHLLTVLQIESRTALESVEQIAAVDGAAVLFLGPFDLSFDLGIPGEFSHPKFEAAVVRVAQAAQTRRIHAGILLPPGHDLAPYQRLGYRFILAGSDAAYLRQSVAAAAGSLQKQRAALSKKRRPQKRNAKI
jgi:2-keto-3-deoxy-L-rhamnonate aldolase RhmA